MKPKLAEFSLVEERWFIFFFNKDAFRSTIIIKSWKTKKEKREQNKNSRNKNNQPTNQNYQKHQLKSLIDISDPDGNAPFNHWLFPHTSTSVFPLLCWRPMCFMSNTLLLFYSPLTNYAELNILQTALVKKIILKLGLDYNNLLGQTKIKKIACIQKTQFVMKVILNESLQGYSKSFFGTCKMQAVY